MEVLGVIVGALALLGALFGGVYKYLSIHFDRQVKDLTAGFDLKVNRMENHNEEELRQSRLQSVGFSGSASVGTDSGGSPKVPISDTVGAATRQEVKTTYIKYLYIQPRGAGPAYRRMVPRLGKEIDVYSECCYLRFVKFDRQSRMSLWDRSKGVVDLMLLFPWKRLVFPDRSSSAIPQLVTQELDGQDTYLTSSTYYNGFVEGEEDIAMKMESDTRVARMVVDFSSIPDFDQLFTRPPDAWRIGIDERRRRLLGLEEVQSGIYHIEAREMRKGEIVFLDFHVDWSRYGAVDKKF